MYYIMRKENGRILESQMNRPTTKELQETANFMRCEVYVIQGEHTGMSAAPDDDIDDGDAEQRDFWQIKAGVNA